MEFLTLVWFRVKRFRKTFKLLESSVSGKDDPNTVSDNIIVWRVIDKEAAHRTRNE
jgi:hypothetical protein